MNLNDAFVIDIEVKQIYVPQTLNQTDKRNSFAPIFGAAVHIWKYAYAQSYNCWKCLNTCLYHHIYTARYL